MDNLPHGRPSDLRTNPARTMIHCADERPKGCESAKCKGSMSARFVPRPCTGSLPAPSRRKRSGVPTVLRTGSCSCQRCRTSRKARSHSAARRRTGSSACRTPTQTWSAGRSARPCSPNRSCRSACRPSWGLSRRRPTCRHHAPSFQRMYWSATTNEKAVQITLQAPTRARNTGVPSISRHSSRSENHTLPQLCTAQ